MADGDDGVAVGDGILRQHQLPDPFGARGDLLRELEHGVRCVGREHAVTGVDEVPREEPAPAAELDHEPTVCSHRLEQGEDAGSAGVGVEPEAEVVDEGEVGAVVRLSRHRGRLS
jgi:hypothetical protein